MKKPIIVGYDPGTTAALAIIDTKGKILFLKSKRGFKKSEVIDIITKVGKPLIIAGDRCPLPKSVEKLASTLSCKTYHPRKSLTYPEKERLVHKFAEMIEDDHEKDALASAIQAFNVNSKLFERAESLLSSIGLTELYEKVIESVFFGKVENITEAINKTLNDLREKREIPKIKKREIDRKTLENTILRLQQKIKGLEKDTIILKEYNQDLKKKLRENEDKIRYYKKKLSEKINLDSLGRIRRNMDRLKHELEETKILAEKLKSFRRFELEGYIPIVELDEVRDSVVKDLDQKIDLEDRVILVNNLENAQILNDYRIKALISKNEPSERILEKVDFPIIMRKDISIEKMKNISVLKREEFEEKVKEARKVGFVQWLKGHKKRKL